MRRTVKGTIQRILAHGCVICGMVIVTFQILDWYNPYMNFLGLNVSTVLMIAFCLLSLLQSAVMIFCEPKLSDLFPKRKIEKRHHLKSSKTHPHVQYQSCPKGERFLPHQLSFIHTGIQENIKSNLARR